jgi:hypothetical protein
MKKIRLLAIVAVLIALLIPVYVSAAGVFYCSTSVTTGGSGTIDDPWACSDDTQLDSVINDQICDVYYGGSLYQVFPSSYRYHVVTWYSATDCRVTSTADYAGVPPYTGVDVPTPYIIGAVALAGAGLLAAGIVLRRKKIAA